MPTQYEVTQKETGAVGKVTQLAFTETHVIATTVEFGEVIFENPEKAGVLTNEQYTISEVK